MGDYSQCKSYIVEVKQSILTYWGNDIIYILLDDTERTGTYFISKETYKSMQLGIYCFHFLEFSIKRPFRNRANCPYNVDSFSGVET